MRRDLTEAEERMLRELKNGMETASNLGQALWPVTKAGATSRKPQSFARPAGKLLNQLRVLGLADTYRRDGDPRTLWRLTRAGLARVAGARSAASSQKMKGPPSASHTINR